MSVLNSKEYFGAKLEISLAKPPSGKNKKEEMLRKREQRMIQNMAMAERLVNLSLGRYWTDFHSFHCSTTFQPPASASAFPPNAVEAPRGFRGYMAGTQPFQLDDLQFNTRNLAETWVGPGHGGDFNGGGRGGVWSGGFSRGFSRGRRGQRQQY